MLGLPSREIPSTSSMPAVGQRTEDSQARHYVYHQEMALAEEMMAVNQQSASQAERTSVAAGDLGMAEHTVGYQTPSGYNYANARPKKSADEGDAKAESTGVELVAVAVEVDGAPAAALEVPVVTQVEDCVVRSVKTATCAEVAAFGSGVAE
jgi:hypothetical protein